MKIPFSLVDCTGEELKYLRQVIESGWLTTASKAAKFENLLSERVGSRFACSVNSCTAALHLAAEALGVRPGDKVLVPTMTFTATAEVIRYLGADPEFLDIEYGTALLAPDILMDAMKRCPDGKTAMIVHFGGQAAEMLSSDGISGILDICRNNGVRIVEDAAHAFPAYLRRRAEDDKCEGLRRKGRNLEDEKFRSVENAYVNEAQNLELKNQKSPASAKVRVPIGSIGDVTCFSFYANKTITTGEGGMLTTNNPEIAKRVRIMRLHGIDRDVWDRYTSDKPSWEYDVVAPGFKYNMPDIAAAIGLAQLERADYFREQRERCARFYFAHLKDIGCIDLPVVRVPFEDHAWHLFVIVLTDDAPVSRNRFIELMAENGIGTSVHYKPLHRMTYYKERYNLKPEDFPNAERMWKGCVSLPIYPSLSDEDLGYVVETIRKILG